MLEATRGPDPIASFDDDASEENWSDALAPIVEEHFIDLIVIRDRIWSAIREDAVAAGVALDSQQLRQGYCNDMTTAIDALYAQFGRFFSEQTQHLGRET